MKIFSHNKLMPQKYAMCEGNDLKIKWYCKRCEIVFNVVKSPA
jgi:hypothetical protein